MAADVAPAAAGVQSERAFEPIEEAARRACLGFGRERSAVEALDSGVELPARIDQSQRVLGQLRKQGFVALGRVAEAARGAARLGAGQLAGLDRALGEQPGD